MKTKTIAIPLLALFVVTGLFVWGYTKNADSTTRGEEQSSSAPKQLSNYSNSQLTASSTHYDFGQISMMAGNVETDFLINNPSESDITVSNIVTSCMCTTAFIIEPDGQTKGPFGMIGHGSARSANEVIKAGDSRIIRVIYDPNSHGPAGVGVIDRSITITDNNGQDLQLEIKAVVTP